MKYNVISIVLLLGVLMWGACDEYQHEPYGTDQTIPGVVTEISVTNIPGGAEIFFTAPNDPDLLYVKAVFTDNRGIDREVKVSSVMKSLLVKGFGETGDYNVELYAVDRLDNQSESVDVTISPLEPPVNLIFPTLEGQVDYGGITVKYNNELGAEVSLNVAVFDPQTKQFEYRESFFTSQKSGSYSFRGFNSVKTRFGVYVEDRWGNLSDTLHLEVTPIPDEYLDKSNFSIFKISGDQGFGEYGFSPSQMWNNVWDSQWDCGSTASASLPHYLTIDLGVNVKLSRMKLYQRGGLEYYKHGNPKYFKIYGTKDVQELPEYDWANPNKGWTLLRECHSFKPSGLPVGQVSAEDEEYQIKGEEFVFDVENLVEIRYVRFEFIENWGGIPYTVIGELSFWGEIADNE